MTLSSTEYYVSTGESKEATRARQAKYRRRQRLAMALLHAAEARGLSGGEAIAVLQNADYKTLQECQSRGIR
ncbi:hypothetical protein MPUL_34520 [Mycolicibacterium pulveris]|uniref:Uncharacterized protein n=1 Tax=Mycolicibacterium pulveris TaxID=36813 RepID=A0A7I7ULG0_MYCPV|nr:hypothetical protein MPUL_34520 [Mycolicibacterium pulveris]